MYFRSNRVVFSQNVNECIEVKSIATPNLVQSRHYAEVTSASFDEIAKKCRRFGFPLGRLQI